LIVIAEIRRTAKFERDWKSCPVDVRRSAAEALRKLIGNPAANRLRMHPLNGLGKPTIFKIDVFPNRSWQISFHLSGEVAILRRLCTHKEMDRNP
jgi:mRNA-degrading endonuclease YafQ of YafQ-DinJ toxin-antitoxin module